jgi:maltooligosyltrehalose trehalohydrolase
LITAQSNQIVELGATCLPQGGWNFTVWAPNSAHVDLLLSGAERSIVPMMRDELGYHVATLDSIPPDAQYVYRLANARERPDPASRFQPHGVHGPSQIVDFRRFEWTDALWKGQTLGKSVFYELHVGTYTQEGTFESIVKHLTELVDLGVTTIELMPVAQFSGSRNWGYDGVYPFAPQNSYGGPTGLQKLVDAAHHHGIAVALDVVYNHLGPEGNYLAEYGPYFTNRYQTPWGKTLNYDGSDSGPVRRFFVENALYWLEKYHLDALRLDAVHGIFDFSARHLLRELREEVASLANRLGRQIHLIAESDMNDARILHAPEHGGHELDAQWSDDFHHSLHSLLTGERTGYYADFGTVHHLAETIRNGWFYSGEFSRFRRRCHGNSPRGLAPSRFVVCNQNHDQIGNRALGERLSKLIEFEGLKLAAGVTLLAPFVPLLFMGEEYGEKASFQYFTSHGDPDLIEAVRKGRREEFAAFGWQGEAPDPQKESTFEASKLTHDLKEKEPHRTLRLFYKELLRMRRDHRLGERTGLQVSEGEESVLMIFPSGGSLTPVAILFYFGRRAGTGQVALPSGTWKKILDSADGKWAGPGSSVPSQVEGNNRSPLELQAQSFVVFERGLDRGRYGEDARAKYPIEVSDLHPHRGGYYRAPSKHHPPLIPCQIFALAIEHWCERRNVASGAGSSKGFASPEAELDRRYSRFPSLEHLSPRRG